ncbi:MAG: ParB/RepB/Spo0J family partition protein [Eubacterium sp.]|nr:ParB/RepB/Spo0J family partition protein [Eubacterium sp.]
MALGKGYKSMLSIDDNENEVTSAKTESKEKGSPAKKNSTSKVSKKTSTSDDLPKSGDIKIKINDIEPNKYQPRKEFNEDALADLADSIKKFGIIEPIVVTKKGKSYQIIAGERRWRAARIAGLKEVPVIVREFSDKEQMEVALIENLQREDLNPIEEALAYQSLIDEYNLKQDEVAERVSKGRSTITNALRLLKLSDKVKQMLIDDMISTGHARCLLAIEDEEIQYNTAQIIFDEGISVRDTEQLVKSVNNVVSERKSGKKDNEVDPSAAAIAAIVNEITENLKTTLGSKVNIKPKGNKGKIEIEYTSADDLERIVHIINTGAKL